MGLALAHQAERLPALRGRFDLISGTFEGITHKGADIRIAVDHHDSFA